MEKSRGKVESPWATLSTPPSAWTQTKPCVSSARLPAPAPQENHRDLREGPWCPWLTRQEARAGRGPGKQGLEVSRARPSCVQLGAASEDLEGQAEEEPRVTQATPTSQLCKFRFRVGSQLVAVADPGPGILLPSPVHFPLGLCCSGLRGKGSSGPSGKFFAI